MRTNAKTNKDTLRTFFTTANNNARRGGRTRTKSASSWSSFSSRVPQYASLIVLRKECTKRTRTNAITDWMDLNDVDMNEDDDSDEDEDEDDPCVVARDEDEEDDDGDVEASEATSMKPSSATTSVTERDDCVEESRETLKKKKKKGKKIKRKKNKTSSGSSLLVFSGGTAMNGICDALRDYTTSVTHVLPVSDDGGSTSEIIRVSGGPAVGDIRSRCLRLSDESTREATAVKALLAHRLHPTDEELAKNEWYKIQEGDSPLWDGIDNAYATIIRRFLVHFHTEVTTNTHKERFAFVNGSIGNFFFAGARMFFRSMEAAIFLYARVSKLPR